MHKPTLVLLPGLMCDLAVWESQIHSLSAHAECIVPSYGLLDSLAAMAQLVLAKAPTQFMLAGHSMGGRIALEIARVAPERITRMALLDTGYQAKASGSAGDTEAQQRLHLLDIANTAGMRAMGREWVQGMVHPEHLQNKVLIESILSMIARHTTQTFSAQIHALLNRPDATDVLRSINFPALIICGRQDAWSPLSRHEKMLEHVNGSVLEVIENSGHMSTMEQPAQVTAILQHWISE